MLLIPQEYKKYIASVKRKCKYHGVTLLLSPSKQVVLDDDFKNECSGYFDRDELQFVVAVGRPIKEWIQVFVHEASHMDQWIQNDPRIPEWDEATGALWDYMAGKKILNKTQIKKISAKVLECELDCEQRSVETIKKWNLPINIDEYIQDANAYVLSYLLMWQYKRFPTGITKDKELINTVPTKFLDDYRKLPEAYNIEAHRFFKELSLKTA